MILFAARQWHRLLAFSSGAGVPESHGGIYAIGAGPGQMKHGLGGRMESVLANLIHAIVWPNVKVQVVRFWYGRANGLI